MRVLLTAFEPYDEWSENASWLALVHMLRDRPENIDLVTRRYPVNLAKVQECLNKDLAEDFDAIIHTGQAPGCPYIKLESIAINFAGCVGDSGSDLPELVSGAPVAFHSSLPWSTCASALNAAGIPSRISYHAGTFLCNAVMYLSHLWYYRNGMDRPVGFVHLPLSTSQVARNGTPVASLPTEMLAEGLRIVLESLASNESARRPTELS